MLAHLIKKLLAILLEKMLEHLMYSSSRRIIDVVSAFDSVVVGEEFVLLLAQMLAHSIEKLSPILLA